MLTKQADTDAISEVEADFNHWRQTRNSPLTPERLKQQALSLLEQYRISDVCKRLRINHQTLKRWYQQSQPESMSLPFIELPSPSRQTSPPSTTNDSLCLTLSRQMNDGSTVSVQGELSQNHWQWALRLLQQQEHSA